MRRRGFLGSSIAFAGASALGPLPGWATPAGRVRPSDGAWPADAAWDRLKQSVGGRLSRVALPDLKAPGVRELLSDPFYLASQPGLSQSSGWLDAWRSSPSAYAVAAESPTDVAAAVRFGREHNLRLAIKGRGHSYLGTSTAADSLLIWTERMTDVKVHDAFTAQGSVAPPVPAVSVGAGCMWLHAYQAVAGVGRYVQGGGCTTVGVAGLVQGGGFGSHSKGFGTAAASLIEAEVVTADGELRTVNSDQEPELFWALKGGGGGTFGVVTRLTLATHELPDTFGPAQLTVQARSDEAFRRLIARFVDHYATDLFNSHWGEQVHLGPDNTLQARMVFQGLKPDEARSAWKGLTDFIAANAADYDVREPLMIAALPARLQWDADIFRKFAPQAVRFDGRPGAGPNDFWWTGDAAQVGVFWYAYTSAWLPAPLLRPQNQAQLVDALFAASRHWDIGLHFNKGLAGAPASALAASRDTATNPDVLSAFALAIIADAGPPLWTGGLPDPAFAHARAERVQAAMKALRAAAPHTGAYLNECDYFQDDWQRAFWGPNYPRLLAVKRRYDPDGLFTVHHGVGSEGWSADGFTRT